MTVVHEFPSLADTWTADHWACHCENYRVDTPDGPIGFVEKVLFSEEREPEAVAVRIGRFQTRLVTVPIEAVVEIRPEWEILVLSYVPQL